MPRSSSGSFFRSLLATVLGLLAVVLLPVGLVAFWASTTLTDTDAFAQELGPVVTQPKVQDALADSVTNGVLDAVRLQPAVERALEPVIRTEATKIVASRAVQSAWTESIRSAHEQFVAAMQGRGNTAVGSDGRVQLVLQVPPRPAMQGRGNTAVGSDGRVQLVLQVPLPGVTEALQQAGVPNIAAALKPTVRVPLVDASQMSTVQRVYGATSAWGTWGPVAVAALGLLAVAVAVRHARALGWLAVGWGIVSLLGIVAIMMARGPVVDRVGSPVARTVADAAYGVAARGLYVELAAALGVSVVLLVVAGVAGHVGRARSAY